LFLVYPQQFFYFSLPLSLPPSLPQYVPIEELYPPEWLNPTSKKIEFVEVPVSETWAGMEVGREVGRVGGREGRDSL
jgi:hypothetical protein